MKDPELLKLITEVAQEQDSATKSRDAESWDLYAQGKLDDAAFEKLMADREAQTSKTDKKSETVETIPFEELTLLATIGTGTFGRVKLVQLGATWNAVQFAVVAQQLPDAQQKPFWQWSLEHSNVLPHD